MTPTIWKPVVIIYFLELMGSVGIESISISYAILYKYHAYYKNINIVVFTFHWIICEKESYYLLIHCSLDHCIIDHDISFWVHSDRWSLSHILTLFHIINTQGSLDHNCCTFIWLSHLSVLHNIYLDSLYFF